MAILSWSKCAKGHTVFKSQVSSVICLHLFWTRGRIKIRKNRIENPSSVTIWQEHNSSSLSNLLQTNSKNKCAIYTLRPRQDVRHFPDDILKYIFLNENVWISITISLMFVSKGPINNIPALVQIMACRHYLNRWWLVYWRIYASLGLNELTLMPLYMWHFQIHFFYKNIWWYWLKNFWS